MGQKILRYVLHLIHFLYKRRKNFEQTGTCINISYGISVVEHMKIEFSQNLSKTIKN